MSSKHGLSVSIVIPNWNGRSLLEKNLPSVIAASEGAEIIVADDASSDGSAEWVARQYPSVRVAAGNTRLGFSGNVNRGAELSAGSILVLLNTDVRPERGFLDPLVRAFSDPRVAAAGCLEKSHEHGTVVLRGRGLARWLRGHYAHKRGDTDKRDTAWVSGGSAAYRRDVWQLLGGMDTLFDPYYWEDIDLSYRIKKAGYETVFVPESVVHHHHEAGAIRTAVPESTVRRTAYRNQFYFHWKNISDPGLLLTHGIWTPVHLVSAALSGDLLMVAGYIRAVFSLPRVLESRIRSSAHWKRRDRDILRT